jgi:UDP-N-acetylmuramoylalanine--D-glutamate ligase
VRVYLISRCEHRLEKVKIQNVQYINDSKATNVNATFFCVRYEYAYGMDCGSVDKGNDYNELMSLFVKSKSRNLRLIIKKLLMHLVCSRYHDRG